MLLGYHTSGLQNHRLEDGLRLLADEGYEAVAITPDVCHLDPTRTSPAEIDAIAALLAKLSLLPVIETGARYLLDPRTKHEPTLMTKDPAARSRRLDFHGACARIGRALGAKVVSFWTGIDRSPDPTSAQRLRDGVRASCERIRAAGLEPSLEPEPGMAIATTAQWRALAGELGAEAPRLTLDIGHLYVEWEGEPASVIGRVAGSVAQVHLEDMRRGHHEHLVPGTGDVAFAADLSALRDGGYGGPVCFELSRSSHLGPDAVRQCRDLWRHVGSPGAVDRPARPPIV